MNTKTFEKILSSVKLHRSFVLITVVQAFGSTPAKAGFRMLVFENGDLAGTVGGGNLENAAINQAKKLLKSGDNFLVKEYNLESELKMACGGRVTLFYEVHAPWVLTLVGGGHVAKATAPLAMQCGFEVEIYDNRPEIKANFNDDVKVVIGKFDEILENVKTGSRHMAIVMTYEHTYDKQSAGILINKDLSYLGIIGSKRKAIETKTYLLNKGMSENLIDSIRIPVGLPIGGNTVNEIAVSIVAELIAFRSGKPLVSWK